LSDAGGYFSPDARSNILLHTWSLAVESQFYLAFAIICGVFWSTDGQRRQIVGWTLFAVIGIASLAWCVTRTPVNQPAAFYLLWSRAWEFMAGSVVALIWQRPRKALGSAIAVVGALLLMFGIFGFNGEQLYPGWRALFPVVGAALVIYAGEGIVAALLSTSPMQFIGNISYSIYLWHWPILLAFRERSGGNPSPAQAIGLIAASVLAGWLSYQIVEQPSRRRLRNVAIGALFAVSVGAGFAFTAVLNKTDGLEGRLPPYLRAASIAMKSENPRSDECQRDVNGTKHSPGDFCALGGLPATAAPTMMLWGDSFANMFQPVADQVAEETKVSGIVATLGGCPPFRGKAFPGSGAEVWPGCERYANFAFDYFERTPSIKLVVVAGDWQRYEPNYEGNVLKQIAVILAKRGGRMVLVTAVPSPRGDLPRMWARAQIEAGHAIPEMSVERSREADIIGRGNEIAEIAKQAGNVVTVDPFETLCDSTVCFTVQDGRGLFKDTDHLTSEGVDIVAPKLAAAIRSALVAIRADPETTPSANSVSS
jgi:hypothetical protein